MPYSAGECRREVLRNTPDRGYVMCCDKNDNARVSKNINNILRKIPLQAPLLLSTSIT